MCGGGSFFSAITDPISDVLGTSGGGGGILGAVEDVGQFAGNVAESQLQEIVNDPGKAAVKAALIYSGNAWALPIVEGVEKKEKKVNDEVMPVYDLDAKSWRSFRWDSIKQVRFTL